MKIKLLISGFALMSFCYSGCVQNRTAEDGGASLVPTGKDKVLSEIDQLKLGLKSRDSKIRLQSIVTLRQMGASAHGAVTNVANVLSNEAELALVRLNAAVTLSQMETSAMPALMSLLKHHSWVVRNNAVAILGSMGPSARGATSSLMQLIQHDKDVQVRIRAIEALAQIGGHSQEVQTVLIETKKESNMKISSAAQKALDLILRETPTNPLEP